MRLTKEKPDGNFETALNLFYAKDRSVWVRGGGPSPAYEDVSLDDWIRSLFRQYGDFKEVADYTDSEVCEMMGDMIFDGTETIDGLLATIYQAAWAFAEIRAKLEEYEDIGLEPREVKELKARMDGLMK